MPEAFIIDAVRTPVTRRGGGLAGVHPADLGAHVIKALLARTQADPGAVDDVVFGCVDTVGPQAGDIARTAWLAAGLPEAVPGVTVDRQCGSSQQAVHFAAQAVLSGTADLVVAGGVQNMSMVPIAIGDEPADPFSGSEGWRARYGTEEISQFRAADLIAAKWGISRAEMERLRAGQPPAGRPGDRRRRLHRRDRALRRHRTGRGPAPRHHPGEDGRAPAAARGRPDHRRAVQPDLRRRGRPADRLGRRGPPARAAAAGPDHPPVRARRRPGADAHRADRRDRPCPAQDRAHPGRHRPGRDQRGVRVGGPGLAARDRRGPGPGERQRRRDRARPPARRHRRPAAHHRCVHALERTGGRRGLVTMCEGGGQANVTIVERM